MKGFMSANMPMKSFFTFTVISRSRPNCCTGRYIISRLKVCKSFVSIKKHGFQKAWKLCLSLIKYSRMSDREVQFSSLFQTDSKTLHLAPTLFGLRSIFFVYTLVLMRLMMLLTTIEVSTVNNVSHNKIKIDTLGKKTIL